MVHGGASSSKSYSVHQAELIRLLTTNSDTLVIRKHATDLKDSTYQLFKQIASDWGITDHFKWAFSNNVREIRNKITQKRILFRGLDDTAKIKSIAGVGRIIVEEAEEITLDDFKELNRRARGYENIQIIFIFNPIVDTHWIYDFFFNHDTSKVLDKTEYVHATYKDNLQNLTQADIDNLLLLKEIDYNQYKVYALGEWGAPEVDRPFFYNFTEDHIADCGGVNPNLPVCLSFDFNVDPATCLVSQFDNDIGFYYHLDEFRIRNANTYDLCEQVKSRYGHYHLKVTGDATGASRKSSAHKTDWQIIEQVLGLTKGQMRDRIRSNPNVSESRTLSNAILARHPDHKIHPRCEWLIDDLRFVQVKEDGSIDKTKDARRTHLLDCKRYADWTWMRKWLPKF